MTRTLTYDPALDKERLDNQMGRVFDVMSDGEWHTLSELENETGGDPQASISAHLRSLRKAMYGSHTVNKRRRGEPRNGLWEYQLVVNVPVER